MKFRLWIDISGDQFKKVSASPYMRDPKMIAAALRNIADDIEGINLVDENDAGGTRDFAWNITMG